VPRDLETICLKALAKEPARRYATARALADDLSRYLEGRPIVARPTNRLERLMLWCRRNPLVAGLTAAVAGVLLVGAIVSTVFGLHAGQKAAEAQASESTAKESEADLEAFSDFLVINVLATARPAGQEGGLGVDVTVKKALDAAAPKISQTFRGRPKAEAMARAALGQT
jgi:hypothetical protein